MLKTNVKKRNIHLLEIYLYFCNIMTMSLLQTFHRLRRIIEKQGQLNPFTFIPVGKDPNYVSSIF